jgi:hypothetical protein
VTARVLRQPLSSFGSFGSFGTDQMRGIELRVKHKAMILVEPEGQLSAR